MATIEIVQNTDGTSGLHSEQKEREVHLFSDSKTDRKIGWKNYRIGSSYMCDETMVYPFFINLDEVREKGWVSFALTPEIDQDPRTDKRIFNVWFSNSDVDCLRERTAEYLEIIGFSVPMVNNSQQREINKRYRERILQAARDSLL